jgi:hypothetical protein
MSAALSTEDYAVRQEWDRAATGWSEAAEIEREFSPRLTTLESTLSAMYCEDAIRAPDESSAPRKARYARR